LCLTSTQFSTDRGRWIKITMASSPPASEPKKDETEKKKSFGASGGVAHDLGITNPLLYLSDLATVSGNMVGNTPKPTDIDGLFVTGMRHLNMSQWEKAAVVFQDALEKAAQTCKVKKTCKSRCGEAGYCVYVQGFYRCLSKQSEIVL